MTNQTIEYYNRNADEFVESTVNADMNELREKFLRYIPDKGKILDLGCGSGRDSRFFLDSGYRVVSVDGSEELCERAGKLTGQSVICSLFTDYMPEETFDGIWACASLLHLSPDENRMVMNRLAGNLVPGGCFYLSFKYGAFEGIRNGRYFTDMTEERFENEILKEVPSLKIMDQFRTGDVRAGREKQVWLNVFLIKE